MALCIEIWRYDSAGNLAQPGSSEVTVYSTSPVRIGRHALNDLELNYDYVSKWHAIVRFDDRKIEYLDLGSTNGTRLRGQRVESSRPIPVGEQDVLQIGLLGITMRLERDRPVVAPPSPPAASVEAGTRIDHEQIQGARQAFSAIDRLSPMVSACNTSWRSLVEGMQQIVPLQTPTARLIVLKELEKRFPEIKDLSDYQALKASARTEKGETAYIESTQELARAMGLPEEAREHLLTRIAELLDAFCTSFVELRNGFDQFSSELAVRTFQATTPLHVATSGREVLEYLTEKSEPGADRVKDLQNAFADMMIHQVALISGMVDGVRGLLQRLSPAAVAEDLDRKPERGGIFTKRKGRGEYSPKLLWRRYEQLHREFMEEDQEITSVLFGSKFAQTYGSVVSAGGKRSPSGYNDEYTSPFGPLAPGVDPDDD